MEEWYPIETAPKDGSDLLCFDDAVGFVVLYFEEEMWKTGFNERCPVEPTHWMFLPSEPDLNSSNDQ